jgi:hypothetical protein
MSKKTSQTKPLYITVHKNKDHLINHLGFLLLIGFLMGQLILINNIFIFFISLFLLGYLYREAMENIIRGEK